MNQLFAHIVWTTRDRDPVITRDVAEFLGAFLPAVATQERATVLALGMVRTHVHLVVHLHPTTSIPRLLQRWKGGSAVIASREGVVRPRGLAWAKSYSITSVSPRQLAAAVTYVQHQSNHHPDEAIPGWPGWTATPGGSTQTLQTHPPL